MAGLQKKIFQFVSEHKDIQLGLTLLLVCTATHQSNYLYSVFWVNRYHIIFFRNQISNICIISIFQGWYIVTYALAIYHLNLFLAFLTPKMDPAMAEMEDEG